MTRRILPAPAAGGQRVNELISASVRRKFQRLHQTDYDRTILYSESRLIGKINQ
jgi:hypothetical protein